MTTLAIDTSTERGSVALLSDGALIFDETFVADRSHSASLFTVLESALATIPHLDRIAIGLGPGSYAGIRIAIAAGLGLQLARNAKLVGLPSVAALRTDASTYLVVGDARREMFYFTRVADGICMEGPLLADRASLTTKLDGLIDTLPLFTTSPLPAFPHAKLAYPCASRLARLAAAEQSVTVRDNLDPIYLREPHITQPRSTRPTKDASA